MNRKQHRVAPQNDQSITMDASGISSLFADALAHPQKGRLLDAEPNTPLPAMAA
jgi:hypothetical protein